MEMFRNENNDLHRDVGPAVVTEHVMKWIQNGRLHRADGPAVVTDNGTKLYYWKGIFIEPSLWGKLDTMTAPEILAHPNTEVRRCLIEKIGFEDFLKRANPTIIHQDKKTGAVLYRVEIPGQNEEPLVVIKVKDGTPTKDKDGREVRKDYFLRVPPTMRTCLEAVAWTFDIDPNEYETIEQET